jgi:UDP-N-acetylglucosamine:LPS N-acetylglucosamine transferase
MMPAWQGHDVAYVTTLASYRERVGDARFYAVRDASRWDKIGLVRMALQTIGIIWRERPDVIITTGAAPGYVAIRIGKLLGARTIWVDSIANVEELSLSGQKAGKCADLWLTQWPHLAKPEGPHFAGAVL